MVTVSGYTKPCIIIVLVQCLATYLRNPRAHTTYAANHSNWQCTCWAEARIKIARMTLTVKLDRNWSSFQLASSAPPLSVTGSAIAPSARMTLLTICRAWCFLNWSRPCDSVQHISSDIMSHRHVKTRLASRCSCVTHDGCVAHSSVPCQCNT